MAEIKRPPQRLLEIDSLRGMAALAVVFFHYTTQFGNLYPSVEQAAWAAPHGHYGVNLFFYHQRICYFHDA